MNYDNIIDKVFFKNNIYYLSNVIKFNKLKYNKYKNILSYINNRFIDSKSHRETLYRIHYNIETVPICPVCGKQLSFAGRKGILYGAHCSNKCKKLDPNVNVKWKTTCIKNNNDGITNRKKAKETIQEKYNVDNPFQIPEIIQKIKDKNKLHIQDILLKMKLTSLQKYGVEYSFQSDIVKEKIIQTSLIKYGVEHPIQSDIVKKKYNWKEITKKIYDTKHKNHTFNTSKSELESYDILKKKYPEVIRQYKSAKYPFACDFYIPSLDLYIECNYHWTHGGKPYEGTEEDINKIKLWKSKNTKFYNNAIKCWSISDVYKRNIAKQNKINYIEFWNIEELKEWIINN